MKRSRIQFEHNGGDTSSASPTNGTSRSMSVHVPKISRKIRACTECKRHKVRCDMKANDAICQRCQRMGLECVVNKSLQTLLDDEAEWKTMIELAMTDLLRKAQLPELSYYQAGGGTTQDPSRSRDRKLSTVSPGDGGASYPTHEGTDSAGTSVDEAQQQGFSSSRGQPRYSPDREETGASSLVTAPMGSLFEVTQLSRPRANSPGCQYAPDRALVTDFISRGVVDLAEAEELFYYFDRLLNHYLWDGIAMPHKDLTSARRSSSLLSAAILTVTALHIPNKERTFDTCYTEFAKLASDSMLSRHHTFDDLRALCIGAFWLSDVSWKLSGYAVRIATERNLHQCYRKAVQGSPEHREQAGLWYLLYVLEHHFSIAYGRPPIIHEDSTITNHDTFTRSPTATQSDMRLHSQVALFIVLTRIYHAFGPDVELEVAEEDLPKIEKFDADLENWRATWLPRLGDSPYVGAYPHKAVYLHYHFSRLTLNSLALRTYQASTSTRTMSSERKKHANIAISSAISTLNVVLDEPDIQRSLVGVPLYLHSMITFAAVFLLKIAVKGCSASIPGCPGQQNSIASAGLLIDVAYVESLVERTVNMMISCSERASERHVSHHIARGLGKMLSGFREWDKRDPGHRQRKQLSWSQETPSLFKPVAIPEIQTLGERGTILTHPSPLLGIAPLSAERTNGSQTAPLGGHQGGLSEGSQDPMMADLWGFDEEYFPTGVFDFLQSQMPA
ncbi:transcriptional regulator family: Fungal Specific TF [Paecilomyces variotii]|nr:transcriptional regulator family: Fungal Specific TF [Paecilomyces variotii]KAJ9243032.1 transcriptional regulator family: Fungal Specific TF [Paecilomyces variotii]KAJ9316197.1 transcriptional regulator family: Fungal Specific TF [Paecilomyces variotii]KAJ9390850.1 transcriptional regulator family: Fungal Specific TF [Paecilomyces variotii]